MVKLGEHTQKAGEFRKEMGRTMIDKEMFWQQFRATIEMFAETLRDCPETLWRQSLWADQPGQWGAAGFSAFWYLGYHTLFWLDLYLSGSEEGFAPPAPFDLVEMEANETLPRVYTKEELLDYLDTLLSKCQEKITSLTDEQERRICRFPWGELSYAELQLYSLRHVQEHGAQLRMFLGQQAGKAARWVTGVKRPQA